jgi:hypothetical protein
LVKKGQNEVDSASGMLQSALLPICKILIKRGLGVGELIDAAKIAYVQAAMSEIVPSGSRINISRLSVVTGLTRKDIAALLHRKDKSPAAVSAKKSLQQRAFRVLHGWSVDPLFQRANGRPADLPVQGDRQSFSLLVKRHAGDVTPISVLRELERMKAVAISSSGKVKFRGQSVDSTAHAAQQMAEFVRLFKDFANTLQQISTPKEPPLFFGFKDSTVTSPHQAALFQRTFSRRAMTLLEGIDQWIAHQTKEEKGKRAASKSKTRVGLGVYLVQEDEKS